MTIREQLAACRGAVLVGCACLASVGEQCPAAQRSDGQLTFEVVDSDTDQPIAARIHLKNARRRSVTLRQPGTAEFGGHFYIDGSRSLPLRVGQYTFVLDAGPEYRTQSGHFEIERHADDSKRIEMKRFANLRNEGWYGGDLDVSRRVADLPLILRAEGLGIMPVQEQDHGQRRVHVSVRVPIHRRQRTTAIALLIRSANWSKRAEANYFSLARFRLRSVALTIQNNNRRWW